MRGWVDRKAEVAYPTKVPCSALQNTASIASKILTAETLVVEKPEKKPGPPPPATTTTIWTTD